MKAISNNIKNLIKLTNPIRKTPLGFLYSNPFGFNKFQTALFSNKKQGSVLQQFVTKKAIAHKEDKDQSKISAKLLCELIGSKYYPTNEEIEMDPYTVVTVYDENDQLIGHKNLIDIQKYAYDLKKDVVLRNNNVKPPVVKVMKYKITLLKRLIKKLSKKSRPEKSIAEERERSTKLVFLSVNISKNDLDHKIIKCKDYLSHFTNLRIAVKLDSDDKNESLRANNLLKNIAKDLNEFGSVRLQPQVEFAKKLFEKEDLNSLMREEQLSNIRNEEDLKREEQELNEAKEEVKLTSRGIEKSILKFEELANMNVMYMELESQVIDASGIDFEKLLETVSIEDLVRGSTDKSFLDSFKKNAEDDEKDTKTDNKEINEEKDVSIEDQLTKITHEQEKNFTLKIEKLKKGRSKGQEIEGKPENFSDKMRRAQLQNNLYMDISRETKTMDFNKAKKKIFQYTIDIELKKQATSGGGNVKEKEEKSKSKKKAEKK
jgi:translation initiation factor IF-3